MGIAVTLGRPVTLAIPALEFQVIAVIAALE